MFDTILIANRGEIACRIIRTTRRMGIKSVVVYSHADRFSPAVLLADQAVCITQSHSDLGYLNIHAVIQAALQCGAQAIHPGYGFLSENPQLAQACETANLVFIGPSIEALTIMGSKQQAKKHLAPYAIPMIPGYHGQDQSDDNLLKVAIEIGFPLMIKAAAGGGGKGLRAVYSPEEWSEALQATRREASTYFADNTMIIEKKLMHARHLEVQIMADHHGNVVHIFERDCSVQRRHQKLLEEAPGPHITKELRDRLTTTAITVAKSIQYYGAGTVEFMVDADQKIYFMEMNTRLQVEHPVTEMITQLDLVEWQLRIAAKEKLPCTQENIHKSGHAIECRLYAEDPQNNFLPSMGKIHALVTAANNQHIRLESGIVAGDTITPNYDAMLGKLIASGETRELAITRLKQALSQYHLVGLKTNRDYLLSILNHPAFIAGDLSTEFLSINQLSATGQDPSIAVYMAACLDYIKLNNQHDVLRADTIGFQLNSRNTWYNHYLTDNILYKVQITPISAFKVGLHLAGSNMPASVWSIHQDGSNLAIDDGHSTFQAWTMQQAKEWIIDTGVCMLSVRKTGLETVDLALKHSGTKIFSPMPGTIVAILHKTGDHVRKGDAMIILEAMKMEHTLYAPCSGMVETIFYELGVQVIEAVELILIKEDTHAT